LPNTGNDWLSQCPTAANALRYLTPQQLNTYGYCVTYARAFADAISFMKVFYESLPVCLPSEVQASQLSDLLRQYSYAHPEQRHYPAGALLAAALVDAFPCKDKPNKPTTSYK
jgi:hypothetical protein